METEAEFTAEAISEEVLDDANVYQDLYENFINEFYFEERSLLEWSKQVSVKIPKDVTPQNLRDLFSQVSMKLQIASHYLALTQSMFNALDDRTAQKRIDAMATLVADYESRQAKRPGVPALEKLASKRLGELLKYKTISKILRDFWKQKFETLQEVRKLLEQIAISHSVEMKYLEGGS